MIKTRFAGALAALALLAAPSVAAAHGGSHHKGRHHHKHHIKKAQAREVTGTATATVQSFSGNELTIALPSGKTFSALVTDRTVITCQTPAPHTTATASSRGDDGDDDDAKGDDDATKGDDATGDGDHRDGRSDDGDDNDQGEDDDQGDDDGNGRCDATALVAGAKVSEAKLSLKGGDATWKTVEILK
jgi:hypothetical protein